MKCFPLKKDAEAYLGKVQVAKREGRYHDVFDVKKETRLVLISWWIVTLKTSRARDVFPG